MSYDSVRIDPDAAGAALRAWQASADELRRTVTQRSRAIEAAEGARPWGDDASGQQFGPSYLEGAGPARVAAAALADQCDELGGTVQTAVQASLASDEEQAATLAPVQATVDRR
ncbi:hypothetical protein TEK04_13985 [Klenkia sp. LSe6-5]|uniref:Excreted virulence factor EspC, type VII ESX diderm n=1 Tax=Klenkia sesuvii TaxID=3103137 RepID=A0ABU8DVX1_9ACTN